jgi:hypothetical protein
MADIRYDLAAEIRSLPMPATLAARPVSADGYPVPYYAAWFTADGKPAPQGDGTPDFGTVDRWRARHCLDFDGCWLCGRPLGKWRALIFEPICLQTGIVPEPDSHPDCAEYAVRARSPAWPTSFVPADPAARMVCLFVHWQRRLQRIAQTDRLPLFRLPATEQRLTFWLDGERASRPEVFDSIDSRLAPVRAVAERAGRSAIHDFDFRYQRTVRLVERWTDDFEPRDEDGEGK